MSTEPLPVLGKKISTNQHQQGQPNREKDMNSAHKIKNNQPNIMHEAASVVGRTDDQPYDDEFFNQIMFRSFMMLSISVLAANLRVIVERFI